MNREAVSQGHGKKLNGAGSAKLDGITLFAISAMVISEWVIYGSVLLPAAILNLLGCAQ